MRKTICLFVALALVSAAAALLLAGCGKAAEVPAACHELTEEERAAAARFTASDFLKDPEGTVTDLDATVQDLAAKIVQLNAGDAASDICHAVPASFLRADGVTPRAYVYTGSEYGFAVVHETSRPRSDGAVGSLWLYLYDLRWMIDEGGTVQSMRVAPLAAQQFEYCRRGGKDLWVIGEHAPAREFYLADVGFAAALFNENAYNYGETGDAEGPVYERYNESLDFGVSFTDASVRYEGVGLWNGRKAAPAASVAGKQSVGLLSFQNFDRAAVLGGASFVSAIENSYGLDRSVTAVTGSESALPGFDGSTACLTKLRAAAFEPVAENGMPYLLGKDGYADFTVRMSGDDNASRLYLNVRLNVVMAGEGQFSYLGGSAGNAAQGGTKEAVLYVGNAARPYGDADFLVLGEEKLIRLLPGGCQRFIFTSYETGTVSFAVNDPRIEASVLELQMREEVRFRRVADCIVFEAIVNRVYCIELWSESEEPIELHALYDIGCPVSLGENTVYYDETHVMQFRLDPHYTYEIVCRDPEAVIYIHDLNTAEILEDDGSRVRLCGRFYEPIRFGIFASGDSSAVSEDVTFTVTAVCEVDYYVRALNGGWYSTTESYTAENGAFAPLPTAAPKGYELIGWYYDSDYKDLCTGAEDLAARWNSPAYAHDHVALYAKLDPIEYTVHFETGGGPAVEDAVYNVTTGLDLPDAEEMAWEGHTFIGWYENEAFTGEPVAEIEIGETGSRTYYARWQEQGAA